MIKELKKVFFNKLFPNWSPDIALRYLPIVTEINKYPPEFTILDVGSGSLGITPYLKRKVTGADKEFLGPETQLLKRVKTSAIKLPFNNSSYDIVLCVDVLEHVSPNKRSLVVGELIRIAKNKVFLSFPSGEYATKEDQFLFAYLNKKLHKTDQYLAEHLKFGLPDINIINSYIPKTLNRVTINYVNIYLHRIILIMQFSDKRLGKIISSFIFILMLPIFSFINFEPTYRKLIIVDK